MAISRREALSISGSTLAGLSLAVLTGENPHVIALNIVISNPLRTRVEMNRITIDVPGADGKTAQWMIETSNPNGLMRLGWTKRSLKAGDQIEACG